MTSPTYDILVKQGTDFVWMEVAHELESAKERITELSGYRREAEFVVFDQRTMQVVARSSQNQNTGRNWRDTLQGFSLAENPSHAR
jgi:hypothetical protein